MSKHDLAAEDAPDAEHAKQAGGLAGASEPPEADEVAGTTDDVAQTKADEATDEATDEAEANPNDGPADYVAEAKSADRGLRWLRITAYGMLPAIALLLTVGAGYAKWRVDAPRTSDLAGIESLQAAKDGTVAMLAYQPGTVEKELTAARDRMTGTFRDSYTSLINDMVIPGAKEKQIAAVAEVPAAALVSTSEDHAVVLAYVNQTTTIGADAPTSVASSVRVTLDKINGRWLISGFDPV